MPPPKIMPPPTEEVEEINMDGSPTQTLTITHEDGDVNGSSSEMNVLLPLNDEEDEVEEGSTPLPARRSRQPPPTPARAQSNGGTAADAKRSSKAAASAARHSYSTTIHVAGLEPSSGVTVSLDVSGQHTLSWDDALSYGGKVVLPAGTANLYLYPALTTREGERLVPSGPGLQALNGLVLAIATSGSGLDEIADEVGAFMQHALTVSNTPQGLVVVEQLLISKPSLLTQVHVNHRVGLPLFAGESSLHICAVNRREELLCRLIELAVEQLETEDVRTLFRSQAAGVFFNDAPMLTYGGTALAYACAFELKDAIRTYLGTGLVSLNERADACVITGFLPVHVVIAQGSTGMYDYLTQTLEEDVRADSSQITSVGRLTSLGYSGLTPLGLAALLGNHATLTHLMRHKSNVLWKWGPVTQYSIPLEGIDSSGAGGGDIMELIARVGASKPTRELLLDEFMQGFIFNLYQQKWARYRKIYFTRFALDLCLVLMLIFVSFTLKSYPERQNDLQPLFIAMLGLMVRASP